MIEEIFKILSERFYNENCLSDITYAMAKTDTNFMKVFMGQFDFDFKIDKPWEMYREYTADSCRVDFGIEQNGKLFIIENKINDQNNHFEQYRNCQKFFEAERGFIANYRIDDELAKKYGFTCVTWGDFIKVLESAVTKEDDVNESATMYRAYIAYVRKVCEIIDMKDMRLDNIVSLYYFNNIIKQTIQSPGNGYDYWLYNQGKACAEGYSGSYFCLRKKNSGDIDYPWFGIWYDKPEPVIGISFWKGWCPKIYENYIIKEIGGTYFAKPFIDEKNTLVFTINEETLKEFRTASIERQREILQKYFSEVICEVGTVL